MTLGGWIFMSASLIFVVSLVVFCFYRVLTSGPEDATSAGDDGREP